MTYRTIDPTTAAEYAKTFKAWAFAVRLDFESETKGLVEGPVGFDYDGVTYVASHDIGDISPVTENLELATPAVTLSLNGIASEYASIVRDQAELHWRPVTIFRVFFSPTTYQRQGDPAVIWRGRMDRSSSVRAERRARVSIECTNALADAARTSDRRYTGPSQRSDYPDDGLYDHVTELLDQELVWGTVPVSGGGIAGGSDRPVEALP